jgi:GNAT superfamily N-acetyltransferase
MTNTEIPLTLGPLGKRDRAKGIKLVARMFAHLGPEKQIIRSLRLVDESLSLALRRKDEIVGVYLVRKPNYGMYRDIVAPYYSGFKDLRVEALAVLPSLRGQGYGRLLRAALPAMAERNGFDFIWGTALAVLNNKHDWLKRRVLERQDEHGLTTVEPLNDAMRRRLADKATPELLARWKAGGREEEGQIEGRLVLETADKKIIPWVIGPDRAYHGSPLRDETSDVRRLCGTWVRATGRICGETFAGSIAQTAEETVVAGPMGIRS